MKIDGEFGFVSFDRLGPNVDFVRTKSRNSLSFQFYDRWNGHMCKNAPKKWQIASFTKGFINTNRHFRKFDRTESSSDVAPWNKKKNIDCCPKREGGVSKSFLANGDLEKTQNTQQHQFW